AGKTVAAYWPIKEEIDIRPVLHGLAAHQAVSALPVMTGETEPMTFRRWSPADPLVPVAFEVYEPDPALPEVAPDIVIVPLLGFDAAGNRIGYGGGYYDRTLARLREHREVLAVGVAYDEQACEDIPVHAGDAPLDVVITDRRVILPGREGNTD
ncbi:MAG: 5-formyltetrahydrofolate cyclo-ligase, partial [Alphaproteobacteria bacterium]